MPLAMAMVPVPPFLERVPALTTVPPPLAAPMPALETNAKVPPASLLKLAPEPRVKPLPPSLGLYASVAVPKLFRVHPTNGSLDVLVVVPRVNPPLATVVPVPDIVPPLQVSAPLTVSVPAPLIVPPLNTKAVVAGKVTAPVGMLSVPPRMANVPAPERATPLASVVV